MLALRGVGLVGLEGPGRRVMGRASWKRRKTQQAVKGFASVHIVLI